MENSERIPASKAAATRRFANWLPAMLIALFAVNAVYWFAYASPYLGLDAEAIAAHSTHRVWFYVHIIGGGIALFVGPWMFWSGLKERRMALHRIVGKVYLIAGSIGVVGGMAVSWMGAHEPKSLGVSLLALGFVWLVCGAMAYRSIRNWQTEQHKEWMIRSFALTVTFVTCRIAGKIPLFTHLGPEAVTAMIWLNWVLTLFLTEVAIQWRKTRAIL